MVACGGGGGRLQDRVDALIAGSTVSMSCVGTYILITETDDGNDWRQADQRRHAAGDSCDSAYRLHIHVTGCTFTGCHGATLSVTRDGVTQSATRNVPRCVTRAGVTALSRGERGGGERGGRGVTLSTGLLQPQPVIIGGWGRNNRTGRSGCQWRLKSAKNGLPTAADSHRTPLGRREPA